MSGGTAFLSPMRTSARRDAMRALLARIAESPDASYRAYAQRNRQHRDQRSGKSPRPHHAPNDRAPVGRGRPSETRRHFKHGSLNENSDREIGRAHV